MNNLMVSALILRDIFCHATRTFRQIRALRQFLCMLRQPLRCAREIRALQYLTARKLVNKADLKVINPRIDLHGKPMEIQILPRAQEQLCKIQSREKNDNIGLRICVESGGCHGFQYHLRLTSEMDAKDDTVFVVNGSKVILDETSLELLNGSKLDFTEELIGSEFRIIDNPYAESKCGCATSFSIDFDKLKKNTA